MLNLDTMAFELRSDGRYIELGGGANPVLRPNVDVRYTTDAQGTPTVDFTVDFEKPFTEEHNQAISTGEFDGVFSRFAFEHVSWRRLPQLFAECARILKPGGTLVLILPNTEAQMRHLLESQDWDDAGSMLFGGQDYEENSHKSAFNPSLVMKLMAQAGITEDFQWKPFGVKATDMVVRATKPTGVRTLNELRAGMIVVNKEGQQAILAQDVQDDLVGPPLPSRGLSFKDLYAQVSPPHDVPDQEMTPEELLVHQDNLRKYHASMFDRRYFDGGSPFGGFQGYWDFPCHYLTAQHVLAQRPESVLELGCARGYVLKHVLQAGVPGMGVDVSRHCELSRVHSNVHRDDVTRPGFWSSHGPKSYDLCYSIGMFDCIPDELLPFVLDGMKMVCKRGLHGINFNPPGNDKTRVTCKPKEWWQRIMPPGHKVVDKNELEAGSYTSEYLHGDGKVKLNLGSFTTMFHHGWTNIDIIDVSNFAAQGQYTFIPHDVREGLPYGTESVDLIYSAHMLEHLTYEEGLAFLKECRRVLKPDGAIRIIVPDAQHLIDRMITDKYPADAFVGTSGITEFDELSGTCAGAETHCMKLYELLCAHHHALYDAETLEHLMKRAGFLACHIHLQGGVPVCDNPEPHLQIVRETLDVIPSVSLTVAGWPDCRR